jgi:hypothetical protein
MDARLRRIEKAVMEMAEYASRRGGTLASAVNPDFE